MAIERLFYSLEAILSLGYKVNSERAILFRKWASTVLGEYTLKGYVLDRKRLENGAYLTEEYFDDLLELIREIRVSERNFYQKITDIYATALDYNKNSEQTIKFYKIVQNKLHYAIHGNTAAELIVERVNAELQVKERIPMTMEDWRILLDGFLKFNRKDVLENAGRVTAEIAKVFAETEFEKYRIIQDRLFESDFDKLIKALDSEN